MAAILEILTILLAILVSGTHQATFTFKNNCGYTVWPGTLTGAGLGQLSSSGFELASGQSSSLSAQPPWSGRFWGRTLCSKTNNSFKCVTGDCASGDIACKGAGAIPPATLVEFTLATNGGTDFFDVSLVDGFNLPMSITPQGGKSCNSTSCAADVNPSCPPELSVKGPDGRTVACKSACEAFREPKYCCTGAFGSPKTCPPTAYSTIFKEKCPQAYSYAYDDETSTFTCSSGANYLITFCP